MEALKERRYTYSDYCAWPDDERWEIIDGQPYNMTPAPGIRHQTVLGKIYGKLFMKMEEMNSPCSLFMAPADVVFDEFNVVQPDAFIVCDPSKITEKNIQGAPDVIFEVKSPSTAYKDRKVKKALYQKHGVKTYVLVDSLDGLMEVFMLEGDHYGQPTVLGQNDTLELEHPRISIPLVQIFGPPQSSQSWPSPPPIP